MWQSHLTTSFSAQRVSTLQWHHRLHQSSSNHRQLKCLFNHSFHCSSQPQGKHQSSAFLALVRESTSDWWTPSQRASKAEIVSRSWHYHGYWKVLVEPDIYDLCSQQYRMRLIAVHWLDIFESKIGNWTRMSGSRLQYYLQTSGPCFKMKCTGNPIVEIRLS